MNVFSVIEIALLLVFGGFLGYLAMLSILAVFTREKRSFAARINRKFAVVVPAHNEESGLARTVQSLMNIDYAKHLFDVIVIADNCTDQTAEVARREGAHVMERTDSLKRGKGHALRWCFDKILSGSSSYDAVVVIDADSRASSNFLTVMNSYLDHGSQVLQCSDMVETQAESWSSEITRLGFTLYNHVRPLGRSVFRGSAGIRGNGMCFSANVLRSVPWSTYSLNEDLEYGLILLLKDITVDFAPEARVYATMPTSARNAESQRSRWERGRFPVIRMYGPKLLGKAIRTASFSPFDAFVELVTPAFVNLFGAAFLLFLLNLVIWDSGGEFVQLYILWWALVVVCGILHVLLGLVAAGADRLLYKAFFYIPRYALWKILLYTKLVRNKQSQEWIRTTRDQPVGSPDHRPL